MDFIYGFVQLAFGILYLGLAKLIMPFLNRPFITRNPVRSVWLAHTVSAACIALLAIGVSLAHIPDQQNLLATAGFSLPALLSILSLLFLALTIPVSIEFLCPDIPAEHLFTNTLKDHFADFAFLIILIAVVLIAVISSSTPNLS